MELKAKISPKALYLLRQPGGGARLLRATVDAKRRAGAQGVSHIIRVKEEDLRPEEPSDSQESRWG